MNSSNKVSSMKRTSRHAENNVYSNGKGHKFNKVKRDNSSKRQEH